MFITDTQLSRVAALHAVGDDDDLALRQNLENPTVDNAGNFDHGTQFLGELTNKAGLWGLAGFEATARQFPFLAFVFEQHDTARFDEDALDGDGEIHLSVPITPAAPAGPR
jgi:hypothetical protein